MDEEADAWFDRELAGCSLADERLNKRLHQMPKRIAPPSNDKISAAKLTLICWVNDQALLPSLPPLTLAWSDASG